MAVRGQLRTIIAFFSVVLAIGARMCFDGHSNASRRRCHMKLSTKDQKLMLCASAAAGIHALLA
jgi:hypothetical protein